MHNLRNHAVSPRAGEIAWGAGAYGPGHDRSRPGSRKNDHRIIGVGTVQEHRVAEHLGDLAVGPRGDRLGGIVAIELRGLTYLELHELVIVERLLDGGHEPVIDPVLADLNDRPQPMTETAKVTTLLAGEHAGLYPKTPPPEARTAWNPRRQLGPGGAAARRRLTT